MKSARDILASILGGAARVRNLPPRSIRVVVRINGKTLIDIDSKLALAMIDCQYGTALEFETVNPGVRVTITEGGLP